MPANLHVLIPDSFRPEKLYVLDILLKEYLDITYTVEIKSAQSDYLFVLPNGNRIVFKNDFFVNFTEDKGYLQKENIPEFVNRMTNDYTPEDQLPIIYGTDDFKISRGEQNRTITFGLDIIASVFFMLTRWEEFVIQERDSFSRMPAKFSCAVKHEFINRPIVNEYSLLLQQVLFNLGYTDFSSVFKFKIIPTHDIDSLHYFNGFSSLLRKLAASVIRRHDLNKAFQDFNRYYQVLTKKRQDPHDTFDELMTISEENGWQSIFYFLTGFDKKKESSYKLNNKKGRNLLDRINERGHQIGFHPGFHTYNNAELFGNQLQKLQSMLPNPLTKTRQHFLQFEPSLTWQIAEKFGLESDSTLGYSEIEGFRAGTCFHYSVFDFVNRKKLKIKESPMIAMDTTLATKRKYSPQQCYEQLSQLVRTVKRYNGEFVLLWHNSNWELPPFDQYKDVYKTILKFR